MFDDDGKILGRLREMGSKFDPSVMMETRELFRSPVEAQSWNHIIPESDIAYGKHERNRLDVYPTSTSNAPVLVFIHGGGFVAGDKASDAVFYGNVPRYFAANGFLSFAMNYRLAPGANWPAGSEDVAAVLAWIEANAARFGGDPDRIVLLGQSAGAAHAAGVIFDRRFALPAGVRGAALLSGFYSATPPLAGGPLLYFGEGEENQWEDRSPVTHVQQGHVPLMLSIAEYDPAVIAQQTLILAARLTELNNQPPKLFWSEGHNHVSPVHSFGIGEDAVGKALRQFFRSVTE